MAKCNEALTQPREVVSLVYDTRGNMEFFAQVQQAFEKAINSAGMEAFKATSMFIRNERIIDQKRSDQAA